MNKLSLGVITKIQQIKLTITLPESMKADIDRYTELYEQAYGEKIDSVTLISHIIGTFLAKDREFQKFKKRSTSSRISVDSHGN